MNTITFIYNGKLRIVKPLAVKQGRYGALLVAESRTGKIKSFLMLKIEPVTPAIQAILDGEVAFA